MCIGDWTIATSSRSVRSDAIALRRLHERSNHENLDGSFRLLIGTCRMRVRTESEGWFRSE